MITNTDVLELIAHCHGYATDLLIETGELFPFGAVMDSEGRTSHREYEIDLKNIPSNGEIIEKLEATFEEEYLKEEARAYALVYEVSVKLNENTSADAIAIDVKHRSAGEIPLFYYPFSMDEKENVSFGEGFAVKRNAKDF